MGAKSFIVRGKGNADSFHSCSHGAGRVMSRSAARQQITLAQHREATAHVECRKDAAVIDESPAAYKDIDAVMAAQSDLVEVAHTLRHPRRMWQNGVRQTGACCTPYGGTQGVQQYPRNP